MCMWNADLVTITQLRLVELFYESIAAQYLFVSLFIKKDRRKTRNSIVKHKEGLLLDFCRKTFSMIPSWLSKEASRRCRYKSSATECIHSLAPIWVPKLNNRASSSSNCNAQIEGEMDNQNCMTTNFIRASS